MVIDIDDILVTMTENLDTDQLLFLTKKLGLDGEYLMPSTEDEWLEFDGKLCDIISDALCNWIESERPK
jgi:hypothetical protein